MGLVFENELYDMTETAKEELLSDDVPWMYSGDAIFEEFPYFGYRTDLVTVRSPDRVTVIDRVDL